MTPDQPMPSADAQAQARRAAIAAEAERQAPPDLAPLAAALADALYANVSADDLEAAPAAERAAQALALLGFARRRYPGVAKVRVHAPDPARPTVLAEIVTDDMPFLFDSALGEIQRAGGTVQLALHPVVDAARSEDGELVAIGAVPASGRSGRESMMQIHVDGLADRAAREALAESLLGVLAEVRAATATWRPMQAAAHDAIADVGGARRTLGGAAVDEVEAFLRWLADHHFTFLGARRYRYVEDGAGGLRYDLVEGSGLGVLADPAVRLFDAGFGADPAALAAFARAPEPLVVLKSDRRTRVHRPGAMDVAIVKTYDADGRADGERRIAGLFTSTVYHDSVFDIPLLRRKARAVLERAGFEPQSHDGKALAAIVEGWPRDELFQIDVETLHAAAVDVLRLQERQRVALYVRRDPLGRFVAALVYSPRDRWDSALRRRFGEVLADAYGGSVETAQAQIDAQSALARALYIVRLADRNRPLPDSEAVERRLAEAARTWGERLRAAAIATLGDAEGAALAQRLGPAAVGAYRKAVTPEAAVADLALVARALDAPGAGPTLSLERREGEPPQHASLKIVNRDATVALSDVLPPLERFGLRALTETPHRFALDGSAVWLQDVAVEGAGGAALDVERDGARFVEALGRVLAGEAESDGFNALTLAAGLSWRDVTILRAYAKFLRQTGIPFAQETMERALVSHAPIAAQLAALFHARFDLSVEGDRAATVEERKRAIEAALDSVSALDDDRILRRLLNAILSTLRTNAMQRGADGAAKAYLSFKLDSRALDELPAPRPLVETFVYSPRMEGCHLRGGRVARGGIRWSDRRDDFRTEILGLMKTQTVKNAVIVPVGAKGGFYVKRPPVAGGREAQQAEGVACYRLLISGLLDLADTLGADGKAIPPADTVRWDGDDPYLVVAADKGTATFSDIANALSADYGFWLDDAFASGGSAGYDHKDMGITARGAWESVKRHFRELGVDVQKTSVTVAGVGDMSGDVFGNGLLRSQAVKLVAAFDHRHIFVDPEPDPARSFVERRRLYDLPRSSWDDYDKGLLSAGGFVAPRTAKSVDLPAQARALLGLDAGKATPTEIMRAILRMQVDLLYFGGIGTYVKASGEANLDAGDRANDGLRIDAKELRARVVGEGANLAMTQRARIEAAVAGVRLNTDALDNSAGVDCSDHEVNIKIALGTFPPGSPERAARDALLASMTDEVAELVLRHNYQQSQAVSVAAQQAEARHERSARLMRRLAHAGKLDRGVEFLPETPEMMRRAAAGQWLTRPELCVLLAYGKIALNEALLASDLPDDPALEGELLRYFPATMRESQRAGIERHRLRREIVSLQTVNSLVNRMGPSFVDDVADRLGAAPAEVVRAFIVARDAWDVRALWADIEALDDRLVAPAQTAMLIATQAFLERMTTWALRHLPAPIDLGRATAQLRPAVEAMDAALERSLPEAERAAWDARAQAFVALGAPDELARRVAALDVLGVAGDVAALAARSGRPIGEAAGLHFAMGARLGIDTLEAAVGALPREGFWPSRAADALAEDLAAAQSAAAASALASLDTAAALDSPQAAAAAVDRWTAARKPALERAQRLIEEVRAASPPELSMLAVAAREIRALATG